MIEKITSTSNPKIKNLVKLQKGSERRKQGVLLVEGSKEITLALDAGLAFEQLFFLPEVADLQLIEKISRQASVGGQVFEVSQAVFEKIAYRETTGGMLAVAKWQPRTLADLQVGASPLVIVIERVEKPGNIGAILRTADAAGVDAVLVCEPLTDLFNPNIIRASLGCVFTVPVVTCTNQEAWEWLQQQDIATYATTPDTDALYYQADFTLPSAIAMGTEADGLSDFWLQKAQHRVRIPMLGQIDSMNVSVATAVVVFEAVRQRQLLMNG